MQSIQKEIVIFGSRTLQPDCRDIDYYAAGVLGKRIDQFVADWPDVTVISGMAKGVDTKAVDWAYSRNTFLKRMPADWGTHGKVAGLLRNQEMCDVATHWLCFWDGESTGTKDMLKRVLQKGIPGCMIVMKPEKLQPPPKLFGV